MPWARAMLLSVSPDLTVYVPPVDALLELEEVLELELLLELEVLLEFEDELLEFETFKFWFTRIKSDDRLFHDFNCETVTLLF